MTKIPLEENTANLTYHGGCSESTDLKIEGFQSCKMVTRVYHLLSYRHLSFAVSPLTHTRTKDCLVHPNTILDSQKLIHRTVT